MASLAAFMSVPYIWPATGSALNVNMEFASATQTLLLRLLECRSGLFKTLRPLAVNFLLFSNMSMCCVCFFILRVASDCSGLERWRGHVFHSDNKRKITLALKR